MKTIASSVLYCLFLFAVGCGDKSDDPEPETNDPLAREFENCRVVSSARTNFSTVVYEYDEQQRLKFMTNNETTSHEYSYNGNEITIKTYSHNDLQSTITVTTDDSGLPLQVVTKYANAVLKTGTKVYEYNDKKQLVKTMTSREGSTIVNHMVYQWIDGNMVAESEPDGSKLTTYTYTDDKNQPVDWFGEIGVDYGLRAIRNKNRVKTITIPNGDVFEHSYSEDSNGLITAMTVNSVDYDYTNNYTHVCK
jgi:hypothetical protein